MAHQLTTCTFCGVGCGIYLETSATRWWGLIRARRTPPTRAASACGAGMSMRSPVRRTACSSPLLRRNGQFQEVTWDEALGFIATPPEGDPRPPRSRCARLSQLAALLERGSLPPAEAGPGRHRHEQRGPRRRRLRQQLDQRPARHARRAGHHQFHRRAGTKRSHPGGRSRSGAPIADDRRVEDGRFVRADCI